MRAFILFLLVIDLFGIEMQTALDTATTNNPSIKELEQMIEAKEFDKQNSLLEKNPTLFGGVNDINLQKPLKRDIEPMQSNYIGISQEITTAGKLSTKGMIESIEQEILKKSLDDAKDKIKLRVYEIFFTNRLNLQKIALLQQKLQNLKKIKTYYKTQMQESKSFFKIFDIEQSIDDTKINIDNLKYQNQNLRFSLQEILAQNIKNISTKIRYKNTNPPNKLLSHNLIMIEKLKVKKQRVLKTLKEKNKTPNITLSAGYYQRDGFDDYVSVGFKLPLPIRVREENEIKKSIKDITKSGYRLQSIKNKLKREYEATKKQLIWLKSAIKRVKEIIKTLKEQKKLYASYTTPESIVKTLKVENKLIKNKIAKKEYQLKLLLTQIKLDYFRSKI